MAGVTYPTTWTELCNAALSRLNVGQISDFDTDEGKLAAACREHLGPLLEEILTGYDWNGLSTRAELPENVTPPAFGYAHAFDLPADFMRFCGEDSPEIDTDGAYLVEGKQILTDAEEVYIRYVYRPTDPTDLPRYLVPAVIAGLAAALCKPLTSSDALLAIVRDEYKNPTLGALVKAQAADARQSQQPIPNQAGHVWYDEVR